MLTKSLLSLGDITKAVLPMFEKNNCQSVPFRMRVDFFLNEVNVAPNDKPVGNNEVSGKYGEKGIEIQQGIGRVNNGEKSLGTQIPSYESTIEALRVNCDSSVPNMDVFGWGLGSPGSSSSNNVFSRGRGEQGSSGSSDKYSRSISMDSCESSSHSKGWGEDYLGHRNSEDQSVQSGSTDSESLQSEVSSGIGASSSDNLEDLKAVKSLLPKRYFCGVCHQGFTRKHNMVSHELIHSTTRPHTCNACKKLFRRVHDLRRHERLHGGDKPFECSKCFRKFARRDALRRHLNSPNACVSYVPGNSCRDSASQGAWINSSVKENSETEGSDYNFVSTLLPVSSENGNIWLRMLVRGSPRC